jgi:hypothetical protein
LRVSSGFPVLIIARHIDLGWTQEELAKQVTVKTGDSMPQSTISRVKGASPSFKSETYEKILRTLHSVHTSDGG